MAKNNFISDLVKQFNRITGNSLDESLSEQELKEELESMEAITNLKLQEDVSKLKSQVAALLASTEEEPPKTEPEEETIPTEATGDNTALFSMMEKMMEKINAQDLMIKNISAGVAKSKSTQDLDQKKPTKNSLDTAGAKEDESFNAEEIDAKIREALGKKTTVITKPWER